MRLPLLKAYSVFALYYFKSYGFLRWHYPCYPWFTYHLRSDPCADSESGSDRILEKCIAAIQSLSIKLLFIRLERPAHCAYLLWLYCRLPGETEEDFRETINVVKDIGFDQSFSFIYSPRPGTPAALLDDPIDFKTKQQWLYELQAELEKCTAAFGQKLIGSEQEVLVEGISRKDQNELKARASNGRITVFKGDNSLIGKMVKVKVVGVASHTLKAELI